MPASLLSPKERNHVFLEVRGELQVLHISELDWDKFKEAFAYDTYAIEGSLVKAKEVEEILGKRKKIVLGQKQRGHFRNLWRC